MLNIVSGLRFIKQSITQNPAKNYASSQVLWGLTKAFDRGGWYPCRVKKMLGMSLTLFYSHGLFMPFCHASYLTDLETTDYVPAGICQVVWNNPKALLSVDFKDKWSVCFLGASFRSSRCLSCLPFTPSQLKGLQILVIYPAKLCLSLTPLYMHDNDTLNTLIHFSSWGDVRSWVHDLGFGCTWIQTLACTFISHMTFEVFF